MSTLNYEKPTSADGYSSLTHQMLRTVSATTTVNGDLYINNSTSTIPTAAPSSGIGSGSPEQQQDSFSNKPLEKSSLFNATISFIVDADISKLPETARDSALGPPCECGRYRMGIWFPVRGKFDSGSNTDFVSEDVIKRAGLESFIDESEDVCQLKIFGVTFDFNKKIQLNWQLNNHENSYTRAFWVAAETDNFDLIIGEPFMIEHGYDIIQNHQSGKMTSFFGFFNLRLPRSSNGIALPHSH